MEIKQFTFEQLVDQERDCKGKLKLSETNENGDIACGNLWNTAQTVLRGKLQQLVPTSKKWNNFKITYHCISRN